MEYEIQDIVRHRQRGNRRQYLVRWSGYDESEDTWLYDADFENAKEILAAYKSRVGL